ncbi:MAG: hypothetical protein L0323_10535, partial [Planctomycetes bacterium]|nr:hypothetical protein [Planctomycetota bacterium]
LLGQRTEDHRERHDVALHGAGVAARNLPIPNDPLLAGGVIFAQAFSLDSCAPQGFAGSQGLQITLQP